MSGSVEFGAGVSTGAAASGRADQPDSLAGDANLFSPFRRLDWRYRSALDLAASGRRLDRARADADVRLLAAFLRRERRAVVVGRPHDFRGHEAAIRVALELRQRGGPRLWESEARILAAESDAAAAAALGVEPSVVCWYESAFFHVRDRLGCVPWLMAHAVRRHELRLGPDPDLGSLWRWAALEGGPAALAGVIDASRDAETPHWPFAGAPGEPPARRSVRMAVAALLLPADTPLPLCVELSHARDRIDRLRSAARAFEAAATAAERLLLADPPPVVGVVRPPLRNAA